MKWIKRLYYRPSTKTYDLTMYVCSECGFERSYDAETGIDEYKFCPNCGAKEDFYMEGKLMETIKQIIEKNPNKEVHLYDIFGTWGELPLTENNLNQIPDTIEINDSAIRFYVG